jgi:hypothetical protein
MAEEAAVTEPEVETPEAPASEAAGSEKMLPQSEVDASCRTGSRGPRRASRPRTSWQSSGRRQPRTTKLGRPAQTELEKATAAREKAEAQAAEAIARANETLVRASALSELAKQGVTNVDGALRALDKTGLTVEDDGTVSGVEEAVKGLLEAIPEFVGKARPATVDQGARGTSRRTAR